MRVSNFCLVAALSCFGFTACSASAGVIAEYALDVDLSSSDTDLDSTASDITVGSSLTHSSGSATIFSDGGEAGNTTAADAVANDFIAEFTITSGAGVDLDNITYTARFNRMEIGDSGELILRSSADGFVSDLVSTTFTPTMDDESIDIPVDYDLSAFTGVTSQTFRFIFIGNNDNANDRTRVVGPIVVNSAMIPEPSSLLLLSLGGLIGIGRPRR